jgi:hypothetical protein
MPPRTLSIGPLRCSGLARGLADVYFDGERLRLVRFVSGVDLLDRYRLVLLGLAATLAFGSLYFDGTPSTALLVTAGLCLAVFLIVFLVEAAVALVGLVALVRKGARAEGRRALRAELKESFRVARDRFSGTVLDVAEADINLMDNVYGAFRPRLVLHTASGRLTLSGWWWRRSQLERLQRRLADC